MEEELQAEVRALGCEVVAQGLRAAWWQRGLELPWWKLRVGNKGFWLVHSVEGWRAGRDALDVLDCTPAPTAGLALYSAVIEERSAMQNELIWLQGEYNEIREAARELRQRVDSAEEEE